MNDFQMSKLQDEAISQKPPQSSRSSHQTGAEMWREFVNDTSLHGIRYVFMRRRILIRLIWLIVLLTSGGYYIFTVYRAFNKYYSRPINTVVSREHLKEMDFPAVTICSLNLFSKTKLSVPDDNPLFTYSGLNISSCAVTSGVRGNRPCGLSLMCCCAPFDNENDSLAFPNCTMQYKQELLKEIQNSNHRPDIEGFYRRYSQDISSLVGPRCLFSWKQLECSAKNFTPIVTQWGMCYTFNSGRDSEIKRVDTGGASSGLSVVLDAQTLDYTQGKFSEGFKVLIHGQGEYFDEFEGINVGPGQHAFIALSQKRYENLEKPYATNCTKKKLKTFSTYTSEGCLYECEAQNTIKSCGCRPTGYRDSRDIPVCLSPKEITCSHTVSAFIDEDFCDCQLPCFQTKYQTEVSYSKFPDIGTADLLSAIGGYPSLQYMRDNLVLLQVGFKSLSYEMQKQQPAYDSNSLFGEIGGNMGLFLGCSLLTIFEFLDFFISYLAARNRHFTHPA